MAARIFVTAAGCPAQASVFASWRFRRSSFDGNCAISALCARFFSEVRVVLAVDHRELEDAERPQLVVDRGDGFASSAS